MNIYQEWAKKKQSSRGQIITLVCAGLFFLLIFPFLIIRWSNGLDQWLGFPGFNLGLVTIIPGIIIAVGGFLLGFWSVYAEITIGSGTPLPMMPTQKLVIKPPFTYCRNPMTLGTLIGYVGFGIVIGSISAILIAVLFVSLLLIYLKLVEEKELEARFGEEYLEYKKRTPFFIPRFWKKD
jgi:protein-S-isoprenylcysteine O-methyltransferase Ste14